ncbi:DUF6636 domain-containing protein [Rhodococcus sp. NPDC058521]|uniref:DUF6636 domain-containing protein n=1 Tax=Rhodococcus sp. NPDC058521 TaxID=3346536 RepID=UPI003658FE7A
MAWRRNSVFRTAFVCVGLGAALAVSGCGGSSDVSSQASTTPTSSATTTTQATTPPSSTTTELPPPPPPPVETTEAPTTTLTDVEFERNESYYFSSPSGGFQCGIIKLPNRTEAGCQGVTSPIPPKPDSCMVSWGNGIRVENEGEGAFMCSGGLVYTSGDEGGDPVLPPGKDLSKLGYTCKTTEEDVTCVNDETSHGFTVATNSNETF